MVLPEAPPPNGVYIHGLFLQGAHWDSQGMDDGESGKALVEGGMTFGGCLTEGVPRVLFESMPPMWLQPYDYVVQVDGEGPRPVQYYCPIYKTTTRYEFVVVDWVVDWVDVLFLWRLTFFLAFFSENFLPFLDGCVTCTCLTCLTCFDASVPGNCRRRAIPPISSCLWSCRLGPSTKPVIGSGVVWR